MLAKRVIACLDVKDGRTVKGLQFEDLKDAGDAVELGAKYSRLGIDELVFLDIAATLEARKTFCELVTRVAEEVSIPFTVGGGIKSVADVEQLLRSGADKISINSAALARPELIEETAREFGSQCIVVAMDVKRVGDKIKLFSHAGKKETGRSFQDWIKEVQDLGAGEILLTSIDCDGVQRGFDLELTALCSSLSKIPVIASGGAGSMHDFKDVFDKANADAALAAGVFHFGQIEIPELKEYLRQNLITVR